MNSSCIGTRRCPGRNEPPAIHCIEHYLCFWWCQQHKWYTECPDHVSHILWIVHIPFHQIVPYLIIGETAILVDWWRSQPEIFDHDPPMSWLNSLPNFFAMSQKLWLPSVTPRRTHTNQFIYIYIYIYIYAHIDNCYK